MFFKTCLTICRLWMILGVESMGCGGQNIRQIVTQKGSNMTLQHGTYHDCFVHEIFNAQHPFSVPRRWVASPTTSFTREKPSCGCQRKMPEFKLAVPPRSLIWDWFEDLEVDWWALQFLRSSVVKVDILVSPHGVSSVLPSTYLTKISFASLRRIDGLA